MRARPLPQRNSQISATRKQAFRIVGRDSTILSSSLQILRLWEGTATTLARMGRGMKWKTTLHSPGKGTPHQHPRLLSLPLWPSAKELGPEEP
jgi:hypothetical protein